MNKIFVVLVLLIVIFFAVSAAYVFWPNSSQISPYPLGITHVLVEDKLVASKHTAIMEHGEIFIALPIVTKYIVPETYWNSNDGKIVLAVKDKIIQLQTNKSIAVIGAESVELGSTPKVVENVPYIPMQFLAKMLDIKIDWAGVNNVVIVDYMKSKKQLAQVVSANAEIRTSPSIKSPILVSYGLKGQVVRVFDEYKKWYKVRTRDGVIGYIDKRYIKSIENY